nr:SNF2-related protein [Actinomycetota bacterium]
MAEDLPGLRDLDLRLGYDTADDALRHFYVPALARAVTYDRSVGFFRASAFSAAARGLSRFIAGGGTARFLVGAELGEADRDALIGATEVPAELAARLAASLVPGDEIAQRRLEVLAWLVREGRLELRVAVAVDQAGVPVAPGAHVPYFHEKVGVLRDHRGDGVAFQGSVNESATGWAANFESFSVYRSWDTSAAYFDVWTAKFEARWAGDVAGFRVFPLPEAVRAELVALAPPEVPPARDVGEASERANRATLARFLLVAPRLLGGERLAEATSAVRPFPHQRKVVERLAGQYPRSWLVADEVGLGKTISAGLALRRLLLTGEVVRALILAPANVCRQWQDELFEKFGLWVPRYEAGRLCGAHHDDVRPVPAGVSVYETEPVLLVSSHLARRPDHAGRILAAPRYDLLIVDEAHHARRRGANLDEYRPSRLLQLLDGVTRTDHAQAVWLLTATPMQVHPIELVDLLRHVGLSGALERFDDFTRYFAELGREDDNATNWRFLARMLAETPSLPIDRTDNGVLERIRAELGLVQSDRIQRFGRVGEDVA